jgi:hypothetical protein
MEALNFFEARLNQTITNIPTPGLHPPPHLPTLLQPHRFPLFIPGTLSPLTPPPRHVPFEPQPLSLGLSSYALTSAFSDHRFNPISLRELPTLEVSVTLLMDFENAKNAMDWQPGVHGIMIFFMRGIRGMGLVIFPTWRRSRAGISRRLLCH